MTSASRYQQIERRPVFTADCEPGYGSFLHTPGVQPPANQRAAAFAIKPDFCNTGGPCGLAAAGSAHGLRGEALVREALHRVSQTAGIGLQSSEFLWATTATRFPLQIPPASLDRAAGARAGLETGALSPPGRPPAPAMPFPPAHPTCASIRASSCSRLDGAHHGNRGTLGNYGNFEVPLVAPPP